MNKYTIGTLSALGIVSVAAVSSLTFAASETKETMKHPGKTGHEISAGAFGKMQNPLSNTGVIAAIQAAGLTVPTEADMKASMEAGKTTEEAIKKLSTDDQTALKTLRDSNRAAEKALREADQAKERDFLRSKGITLPTEDQIAKEKQIEEIIRKTLSGQQGNEKGHGGMMGRFGGERGEHGKGLKEKEDIAASVQDQ